MTQYAPFTIVGSTNQNLCYIQQPTVIQHETIYGAGNGDHPNEPGVGQPFQDITYLQTDSNGDQIYSVMNYSNYTLTKPGTVTTLIRTVTPGGISNDRPQSTTNSYYDAWGNLIASTDAMGVSTYYDYTTPDNTGTGDLYAGLPDGLLLDTYRVDGSRPTTPPDNTYVPTSPVSYRITDFNHGTASSALIGLAPAELPSGYVLLSSNVYYTSSSVSTGAVQGQLAHSTQWSTNSTGQTTYYAYDPMGNTVATWTQKSWSTSSGATVHGWTVSINTFDAAGQAIDTYQGTYVDTTTGGTGSLDISITPATLNASSGSTGFADQISISTPIYNDATQSDTGATLLRTSHTDYNALGQVADTIDQYGGHTTYTYDINGNVIDTVYPITPKPEPFTIHRAEPSGPATSSPPVPLPISVPRPSTTPRAKRIRPSGSATSILLLALISKASQPASRRQALR